MRTWSLLEPSPECVHKIFSHCRGDNDRVRLADVISEEVKLSQELLAGSPQSHSLDSETSHRLIAPC